MLFSMELATRLKPRIVVLLSNDCKESAMRHYRDIIHSMLLLLNEGREY